jgi:hypothetical protein
MNSQMDDLFGQEGFYYGHDYLSGSDVWLHIISNAISASTYFSIVFLLACFLRRRSDLGFKSAFMMFGLFIMLGGVNHSVNIVTLWTCRKQTIFTFSRGFIDSWCLQKTRGSATMRYFRANLLKAGKNASCM